jgi:hypothetical protein
MIRSSQSEDSVLRVTPSAEGNPLPPASSIDLFHQYQEDQAKSSDDRIAFFRGQMNQRRNYIGSIRSLDDDSSSSDFTDDNEGESEDSGDEEWK